MFRRSNAKRENRRTYLCSAHGRFPSIDEEKILVSHHVELLLPSADYLVRILDGRIDSKGTPDELRASGDLDGLIAVEGTEIASEEPVTADEAVDEEVKVADGGGAVEKKARKQTAGKKLVQGPLLFLGLASPDADIYRRGASCGQGQMGDVQAVH